MNGSKALTLTSGTGNIVFGANLGAGTALGALTINSVNTITYPQVNAASIVQSGSTGTTTITGPLSTSGVLGISLTGGVINQNGAITTTGTGPVSFVNTGLLTVGIGVNTIASGTYSQSGGGSVSLGGNITSTNGSISIAGATSLTAGVNLQSGPNGQNITFASAVTGAQALSVQSGSGLITFSANVGTSGTPLTAFTITQTGSASTQSIFAGSISQLMGSGTSTFNGALNASTSTGISLAGTNFVFSGAVTSAGPLILTNSGLAQFNAGATGTITGALTQNGTGGVQISSAITVGGAISFTGAVTIVGTASLSTQVANQSMRFFNTLDGPGNLTLSSGTGNIEFDSSVGSLTTLGNLTIATVNNLTAESSISAASITQTAGTGLSLFDADLSTSGPSGVSLSGVQFTFLGNITTTGGGGITLTNTGTLTTTTGKTFTSNGVFTQNGSGTVLLGVTIATTNATAANANINFSGPGPITLIGPTSINSSTGGGTINFSASSTVNGAQPITLSAGTGSINILGNFGSITRLGAVTFTSGDNIQFQAITAASIAQLAGTGTTSLLGALNTNTPAGILLVGNNFTAGPSTSVTTTNGGSITITNQGLFSGSPPVSFIADGAFIQNGSGPIFLANITARQGISASGPVVIATSDTLDTSAGNGNISFSNTVSGLTGAENLILTAGSGNITFSQSIGAVTSVDSIPVTSLGSLTANGETLSINNVGTAGSPGVIGTTTLTALANLDFTGTNYNADTQLYTAAATFNMSAGSLTTFNSNGSPITFQTAAISLSTGTDLTLDSGGGNITLPIIGAQSGNHRHLIVNASTGSVQVGNLGVQGGGEFASASFTGTNLTLGNTFADTLTFNYTGVLNAQGNIGSTDTPLTFPNPVILQGTSTFSTVGVSGANITFSNILNGQTADTDGSL